MNIPNHSKETITGQFPSTAAAAAVGSEDE